MPGFMAVQKRFRGFTFVVFVLLILTMDLKGQEVQIWLDGFVYKDFGKALELETNIGWDKLIENGGWSEYYFNNTLTWTVKKWYETEGSIELHHTNDPLSTNVNELRLWIAQGFIFTPFIHCLRLEKPYFYLRIEERFLGYPEVDTTAFKTRLRPRIGGKFLIKHTKMIPKTFFMSWYFEGFINLNGEAYEQFALQNRTSVGLGYKFNEKWTTELVHYIQRSRNTIEDSFTRTDLIIQIQIKYYIDN